MAPGPSQQHRSYLLRLWRAGNGNAPQWRLSLEDTRTHERQGFNDLPSLVAFLEHQLGRYAAPQSNRVERNVTMHTTVDLTQGRWRFHTIHGLVSKDHMAQHPAQTHGPNSDVVFSFAPHPEPLDLPEGVALSGTWLWSEKIYPEDAWDHEYGKGKFYLKVFPASSGALPGHQIIEIYQTEYHWSAQETTGDLTIYTGRLYQSQLEGQPPSPPVFFGYGADNTGRQWLTFTLAPSDVLA
jgi:hypothetical protein